MSPELIFASYSWARRDHIVRLMRARPVRISSDRRATSGSDSLRMHTPVTFEVGTRRVILSLVKLMTNSSSLKPATSCSSIATIWPTPCAGYTTNSFSLKPFRFPVFFMFFCSPPCSSRSFDLVGEAALGSFATAGARAATAALTRGAASVSRAPGAGEMAVAATAAGLSADGSGAFTFNPASAVSTLARAAGSRSIAAFPVGTPLAPTPLSVAAPRAASAPSAAEDDFFSVEPPARDRLAEAGRLAMRFIVPGMGGSVSGLDAFLLVFLRAAMCPYLQTRDEQSRSAARSHSEGQTRLPGSPPGTRLPY